MYNVEAHEAVDTTSSAHANGVSLRTAAGNVSIAASNTAVIICMDGLLVGSCSRQRLTALQITDSVSGLTFLSSGSTSLLVSCGSPKYCRA